ncbi:MAG: CvpA family protein [Syntrophobacterales bacterium]|nr:CvpA family protein [Syntrophobacterales bacterium]
MNLLDLGIILLLALIVLRGYYRGFFQELAVLAGVVGGVLVAAHGYPRVGAWLTPLFQNPTYARWAAFGLLLVGVYWGVRLLAFGLQRIFHYLYLDFFDRLLGGALALAKGGLVLGLALMLVGVVLPKDSPLMKESRTAPILVGVAKQALGYLPPDFKKHLQEFLRGQSRRERGRTVGLPRAGEGMRVG